jgi:hypothetical protein
MNLQSIYTILDQPDDLTVFFEHFYTNFTGLSGKGKSGEHRIKEYTFVSNAVGGSTSRSPYSVQKSVLDSFVHILLAVIIAKSAIRFIRLLAGAAGVATNYLFIMRICKACDFDS